MISSYRKASSSICNTHLQMKMFILCSLALCFQNKCLQRGNCKNINFFLKIIKRRHKCGLVCPLNHVSPIIIFKSLWKHQNSLWIFLCNANLDFLLIFLKNTCCNSWHCGIWLRLRWHSSFRLSHCWQLGWKVLQSRPWKPQSPPLYEGRMSAALHHLLSPRCHPQCEPAHSNDTALSETQKTPEQDALKGKNAYKCSSWNAENDPVQLQFQCLISSHQFIPTLLPFRVYSKRPMSEKCLKKVYDISSHWSHSVLLALSGRV